VPAVFAVTPPVPTISVLAPASVAAGHPDFLLTVRGTGFLNSSRVGFNGAAVSPASVSATALTLTVHQADIPKAGAYPVTVTNDPVAGVGGTVTANLLVGGPGIGPIAPAATTIHAATDPALTMTITGSNFVPGTSVSFDGHVLTPSATSDTSLTVAVPATYLTAARTVSVFVTNPGGQVSNTSSFVIGNARLTVTEKTTSLGGGGYRVDLTLTNVGATAATGITITRATLNGKAGTPVPQAVGPVAAGASATASVTFSGTVQKNLAFTVTYSGGSTSPLIPSP